MSQALYRKYRSRGFDEIVGQQHVTDLLATAIKNGSISHAYLFTGPRGTGKTSVARIVAHAINDLPYSDDATHLDIIEIDAASNRRIDDIRDLREKVYIAPTTAKYKVYIIDEVHMLTGESFNALLKTLEEPPTHAVFILATTELHKVPATIVSRTQRFHFRPGTTSDVAKHLRSIADKEQITIDDEALTLIAEHSEGGFRDSVSLLDQVSSIGEGAIDSTTVEHLLGLAPRNRIESIVDDIIYHRSDQAIRQLLELMSDGMSPTTIILQLTKSLSHHASSHPHLYDLLYEVIELPKSFAPQLKLLALIGKYDRPHDNATSHQQATTSTPAQTTVEPSRRNTEPPKQPTQLDTSTEKPVTDTQPKSKVKKSTTSHETIVWDVVMGEVQKRAPALYSILKRATANISNEKITLHFTFALHRKKMNDDKQRRELTSIITNLYGACPLIEVADDKAKLSSTAEAVVDIMGGGVPVDVPKDKQ